MRLSFAVFLVRHWFGSPTSWLRSLVLALVWATAHAQPIVINEVVAANSTGIEDEDGDRPDWIELYNTAPVALSLGGYTLSDDPAVPAQWRLPGFVVPARGFVLVFASGKARTNSVTRLHANFKLRSSGEAIRLYGPAGNLLNEFASRAAPRDVAWGRLPDGSSNQVLLASPTPRRANVGPGYPAATPAPAFSIRGGFFANPFSVRLVKADASSEIRYTLDGSEPTTNSTLYTAALTLRDRQNDPNILSLIPRTATANQHTDGWFPPNGLVTKATVVRARAFHEGQLPSETVSRTWFIGTNSPARFELPVISVVTDTNGLFNYERGIYVLGKIFDDYRAAHPAEELTGHTPANYHGRGPEWQRPGHLEFYLPDGTLGFENEVVMEIQGQSSRSFRQKSLGVRALGGDFEFEIFPGLTGRGTGWAMKGFGQVRLANSGNDWAYTLYRDALCHTLVRGLPLGTLAYRPAAVFLDGEFWGVHNVREQQDGNWIEAHYDIPRWEIAICEGAGTLLQGRPEDANAFTQLREYVRTHDLSSPSQAASVEAQMDVDDFLLYHAAEIYFGNADWPHNNIRYWRRQTADPSPDAGAGRDGRWRWLLFDTDLSYGHAWSGGVGANTLSAATSVSGPAGLNAAWSTVLLRQILKAPTYRDRFLSRLGDLLNSHFREDVASNTVDTLAGAIRPAMAEHIRRWRTMGNSLTGWSNEVRILRQFASQRPFNVRQHCVSYFKLAGSASLTMDVEPRDAGWVRVNSLDLRPGTPGVTTEAPYPWKGTYFRGIPVRVEAQAKPGWRFARWSSAINSDAAATQLQLTGATTVVAQFEPARVELVGLERRAEDAWWVRFRGYPGRRHAVERSTDLRTWSEVGAVDADATGTGVWEWNEAPREGWVFLRLRVQ